MFSPTLSHSELQGQLLIWYFSQRPRTSGKEEHPIRTVHLKKDSNKVL